MKPKLLLVDDDKQYLEDITFYLGDQFDYLKANTIENGLSMLSENPDLILLDVELDSRIDGITAISKFKQIDADTPIIMLTRHDEYRLVVQAIKQGASEYFVKSPETDKLRDLITKTLKNQTLKEDVRLLKSQLSSSRDIFIGEHPSVIDIKEKIVQAASMDCPVLITGETGVGKELAAREIFAKSNLKQEPFVSINVSAINDDLFSSELFGHEKGAFTGAMQRKKGLFEIARSGIIFLDEIGDLSGDSQVKMLRVIDQRSIRRVGGLQDIPVTARILTATNQDLIKLIKDKKFRKDLYFRLRFFEINIPPLRERRSDIPDLIRYFLSRCNRESVVFTDSAIDTMCKYDWPGNIRQLKNTLELIASIVRKDKISGEDIKRFLIDISEDSENEYISYPGSLLSKNYKTSREEILKSFKKQYIENLLEKTDGNISAAARFSGIARSAFHKMIKECEE